MTAAPTVQDAPGQAPALAGIASFHEVIPREPGANLAWRRRVWQAAEDDEDVQLALAKRCKADLLYFVNGFVWLFDPQAAKTLPFATWPFQDHAFHELLAAVWSKYDLLVEKSRDVGASWIVLVTYLWLWLWHTEVALLAVSQKEELVDKPGDPDSLFWKFRFARDRLPWWMRPKQTADANLHVGNLDAGSVLDGRATTVDAGRAGRRLSLMVDEAASIEQLVALKAATADNSKCRLWVSTPKGMNAFGLMRQSGEVKVLTLHWSQHPIKARGLYTWEGDAKHPAVKLLDAYRGPVETIRANPDKGEPERLTFDYPDAYPFQHPTRDRGVHGSLVRSPWYDGECVRRASDMEIAQELDIDYLRSGQMWFDASVVKQLLVTTVRRPDLAGEVTWRLGPDDVLMLGEFQERAGGFLRLWLTLGGDGRPSQQEIYAAGADISEGTGASNSVGSIYACGAGRKVGEYVTSSESPEQFARSVVAILRWFGGASVEPFQAYEQNGPGLSYGKELKRLGYTYVYCQRQEQASRPRESAVRVPGWHSSMVNKRILLGNYRRDLATGDFQNPSEQAVKELLQYIIDDRGEPLHERLVTEPAGARLAHGDRVMADALADLARTEQPHFVMPEREPDPSSYAARRRVYEDRRRKEEDRG